MVGRIWTGPPWQSRWSRGTGPVHGRRRGAGPPQLGAHPGLSELPQHATQGPPTGLHSAGTSPELMEPETSDHNIQPPVLTGASLGSMNSALLGQLPKMTREPEPHCLAGGPCFLQHPPPAVGEARQEGGWARELPGPRTSFSGGGVGGEEAARGSLEGLGAPGRQEGTGRPWLGRPRPGRGSDWGRLPEAPSWGPLSRFSSLRNTARRIFRVGAGPRPGGQTGRREEAPSASLLG